MEKKHRGRERQCTVAVVACSKVVTGGQTVGNWEIGGDKTKRDTDRVG